MAEKHLIKISITCWITKPRTHTWLTTVDSDIPKKISTVQNLCANGSPLILTCIMWAFELHVWYVSASFVTRRNVDNVIYLFNIQYDIININFQKRISLESVTPPNHCQLRLCFVGVIISNVTLSCSQYLYDINCCII